jgi:threonine dehydratase
MGFKYGAGPVTNGEGRTMAAMATGQDPEAVSAYMIIARTEDGSFLVTDECAEHAIKILVEAMQVIVREQAADPEGTSHRWESGTGDDCN